jgi:hypothetical protein
MGHVPLLAQVMALAPLQVKVVILHALVQLSLPPVKSVEVKLVQSLLREPKSLVSHSSPRSLMPLPQDGGLSTHVERFSAHAFEQLVSPEINSVLTLVQFLGV